MDVRQNNIHYQVIMILTTMISELCIAGKYAKLQGHFILSQEAYNANLKLSPFDHTSRINNRAITSRLQSISENTR